MSKQRARARAEREAAQVLRAAEQQRRVDDERSEQQRRDRRAARWRRNRLWRHGPQFRRDKEKWALLATVLVLALLVTYILTGSAAAVLLVVLVGLIAAPAVAMLVFDRRSS